MGLISGFEKALPKALMLVILRINLI